MSEWKPSGRPVYHGSEARSGTRVAGPPLRKTLVDAVRSRAVKFGLVLLAFLVAAQAYELHFNYGAWTIKEEEAKSEHQKQAEAGLMPPGFRAQMAPQK